MEKDTNTNKYNKPVALILSIVLIITVLLFSLFVWQKQSKNKMVANQSQLPLVVIKRLDKNQLPEGLPQNIPIESDAQILKNEKITTEKPVGKEIEWRHAFISKYTLEENKNIYLDYLKQNGWNIINSNSPDGFEVLIGQRNNNNQILRIVISKIKTPPGAEIAITGSEVDITLTEIKQFDINLKNSEQEQK